MSFSTCIQENKLQWCVKYKILFVISLLLWSKKIFHFNWLYTTLAGKQTSKIWYANWHNIMLLHASDCHMYYLYLDNDYSLFKTCYNTDAACFTPKHNYFWHDWNSIILLSLCTFLSIFLPLVISILILHHL